jgi:hypothetical protein
MLTPALAAIGDGHVKTYEKLAEALPAMERKARRHCHRRRGQPMGGPELVLAIHHVK